MSVLIDELNHDSAQMTPWQRHRFFALISGVIIISIILVSVALILYNSSGAAQVDLSRPGYQSIQKEASRESSDQDSFPASGKLDTSALNTFNSLYSKHVTQVSGVDNFDPKALDTDTLQLFTAKGQTPTTSDDE